MSKIKAHKQVVEFKEVTTHCRCDGCAITIGIEEAKNWFRFSSRHLGWRNDSCDDDQEYDVCSFACFIRVVRNALPNLRDPHLQGYEGAEIAGMPYEFAKQMVEDIAEW